MPEITIPLQESFAPAVLGSKHCLASGQHSDGTEITCHVAEKGVRLVITTTRRGIVRQFTVSMLDVLDAVLAETRKVITVQ